MYYFFASYSSYSLLKSAAKIAKGIGVTAKTVCRWVQDYRRQNNLPSYEEDRRLKRNSIEELIYRRTYADIRLTNMVCGKPSIKKSTSPHEFYISKSEPVISIVAKHESSFPVVKRRAGNLLVESPRYKELKKREGL